MRRNDDLTYHNGDLRGYPDYTNHDPGGTTHQIDEMMDIMRKAVEMTMEDVRKEGIWKG